MRDPGDEVGSQWGEFMYRFTYLCDMWTVFFVSHVFSKLDGKVKRLEIVPVIYTLKTKQTKAHSEKGI